MGDFYHDNLKRGEDLYGWAKHFSREDSKRWNRMSKEFFADPDPSTGVGAGGAWGFLKPWGPSRLIGQAKRNAMIKKHGKCTDSLMTGGLHPGWASAASGQFHGKTYKISKRESLALIYGAGPCWGRMDRLNEGQHGGHGHVAGKDPTKVSVKVECVGGKDYLTYMAFGTGVNGGRCGLKAALRVTKCGSKWAKLCHCKDGLMNYDLQITQVPEHVVNQLAPPSAHSIKAKHPPHGCLLSYQEGDNNGNFYACRNQHAAFCDRTKQYDRRWKTGTCTSGTPAHGCVHNYGKRDHNGNYYSCRSSMTPFCDRTKQYDKRWKTGTCTADTGQGPDKVNTPYNNKKLWWCQCNPKICTKRITWHKGHMGCNTNDKRCGKIDNQALRQVHDSGKRGSSSEDCKVWFTKANTFVSAFLSQKYRLKTMSKIVVDQHNYEKKEQCHVKRMDEAQKVSENNLAPGCYYRQRPSGRTWFKCGGTKINWTAYRQLRWDKGKHDNRQKCLAMQTRFDKECRAATEWKFVASKKKLKATI